MKKPLIALFGILFVFNNTYANSNLLDSLATDIYDLYYSKMDKQIFAKTIVADTIKLDSPGLSQHVPTCLTKTQTKEMLEFFISESLKHPLTKHWFLTQISEELSEAQIEALLTADSLMDQEQVDYVNSRIGIAALINMHNIMINNASTYNNWLVAFTNKNNIDCGK